MKYKVDNKILHIIYNKKGKDDVIFKQICEISKRYEGIDNSNFIGFNFPMKFVNKNDYLYKYSNTADYVIVYKIGDKQTKQHELLHAKFYIDYEYKQSIYSVWNSIEDISKKNITDMLLRMKYRNDEEILIDEFQAYYYSEKSNFFGKILFK